MNSDTTFPAAAYDAWKTSPDEADQAACDVYHPARCCDSRCDDANDDGDAYLDDDRTPEREDW